MTHTAGSIRETAREIVRQASQAGMAQACRLPEYTPAEIEAEFEAFAASRRQADLAAWLTGRYVMIGVHAPKRFPSSPDCIKIPPRRMTDEQMKQVLKTMAEQRRESYGGS